MSVQHKKALITGINGQDGSYLAELLLEKGYEVHGLLRREAIEDADHRLTNIHNILERCQLHLGSIESYPPVFKAVYDVQPDECYHLAAKSFVDFSFDTEFSTLNTNISGAHYVLSALQQAAPKCRFYFSGSSEMFGNVTVSPQNESTPFYPRSIYGISKLAGFHLTQNYRNQYGLFACTGILYNHESPRRGHAFVTRKIVSHAVKIKKGEIKELRLGNLDAKRDWGHAKDYVRAMWLMLQEDAPDDFVIASGKLHTVREFVERVFNRLGLNYNHHVVIDRNLFRPTEKVPLAGDAQKARSKLGWETTFSFEDLINDMIEQELSA